MPGVTGITPWLGGESSLGLRVSPKRFYDDYAMLMATYTEGEGKASKCCPAGLPSTQSAGGDVIYDGPAM